MKILIVIVKWKGGVGRVIKSITPLLEKKGYDVEVISREDDLKCYSLKDSFKILRSEVKKRKYDILYTQDWSCALPFLDFKNHYVCFHGLESKNLMLQKLVYLIKGKNVFVVGDKLQKIYPKSHIIYNGVDYNTFKDLKEPRIKIGWIKRDYELITEQEFLKIAKEKGLIPTIATNIPPEKMNEWYNTLNTFVSYPPAFTGFNMCWLEAKAAGVPNILGNENGIGITNINKNYSNFTWENHVNKFLEVIELKY